ncbi:MAG: phosphopentomutase, partial [Clostridia bacterium]|nr:phosphopentomutase [Clostridia bacterium]
SEEDLLIITADHGCDPGDSHTDHTREYVPVLMYGAEVQPTNCGTKDTFAHIAATVAAWLRVDFPCPGENLLGGSL